MLDHPVITIALIAGSLVLLIVVWWMYTQSKLAQQQLSELRDELTQLQERQKQLDIAKADAVAANKAKNRYLSGISHELRTPLNVIMGYAQLLENQAQLTDPHKDKYTLMRHNCEHLAHLIEGILEFSAIESGKLKVQHDEFNLHDLLDNLGKMFKTQAEQKGLKFTAEVADGLPQRVKTDQKRLQQILINLLSNAIKFTERGQVEFSASYRNQVASFIIKDSGIGIKAEDQSRIFKPFERIEQGNKHVQGTGLGLSITQLLVDLLGGDLQVNSQPGQGSEFIFKIMLSAQQSEPVVQPMMANNETPLTTHQHTLMVVDDEQSHRALITEILQPHGFRLLQAANGQEAKQMMNKTTTEPIDLAILDVSMPDMSGWDLADWMRQEAPATKILMLSANPRDMESTQHRAHDAYLTKPIKINQLLNHLNLLLNLGWHHKTAANEQPPAAVQLQLSKEHTTALMNMVDIGHIRGIENYLQQLYADQVLIESDYLSLLKPIKNANLNVFKQMIQHETA